MRSYLALTVSVTSLLVTGCSDIRPANAGQLPVADRAVAMLVDAEGHGHGMATLRQHGSAVLLQVDATGLPAGPKAVHIHAVGRCDGPAFKSAGGHLNPTGREHGLHNPAGPHLGDLVNIVIRPNGSGTLRAMIVGASLHGGAAPLLDADGAALVIHAAADDYRTDPSGNSGARIVCGVFQPERKPRTPYVAGVP